MKRSLSGIQPSGILHLGNYFGAISQFVKNQNSGNYEGFYFIADYHSLTSLTDPKALKENSYNIWYSAQWYSTFRKLLWCY